MYKRQVLFQATGKIIPSFLLSISRQGVVSVYLNGRLRARFRQQRVQIGELNSTIADSLLAVSYTHLAVKGNTGQLTVHGKDGRIVSAVGAYKVARALF